MAHDIAIQIAITHTEVELVILTIFPNTTITTLTNPEELIKYMFYWVSGFTTSIDREW